MHFEEVPNFKYTLTILDDVRLAIAKNMNTNERRILEARRDLFENQGDFYWGDEDIGCKFLAISILAHHFNGDLPKNAPIAELTELLQSLDCDSTHEIDSEKLRSFVDNSAYKHNPLLKADADYLSDSCIGHFSFYEVVSKFGTRLTLLSSTGIKSVVDIEGYDDELIKYIGAIEVLLPGIELNCEPNRKILAIALSVERNIVTGEVKKIVDVVAICTID